MKKFIKICLLTIIVLNTIVLQAQQSLKIVTTLKMPDGQENMGGRSEERRVGKEC